MSEINSSITRFLETKCLSEFTFWSESKFEPSIEYNLQDLCDVAYSLFLLDENFIFNKKSIDNFENICAKYRLYGERTSSTNEDKVQLGPHISAYILGVNRLAKYNGASNFELNRNFDFSTILTNDLPNYPKKFILHPWRVSHWLGGTLSIINNVENHFQTENKSNILQNVIKKMLVEYIDESGLIRLSRFPMAQFAFDILYNLRHNPKHGQIGGIVHITWILHDLDKDYKAEKELLSLALSLTPQDESFFEKVPYCLDFDFIQLIRTIVEKQDDKQKYHNLFENWEQKVGAYLKDELLNDDLFTLHKLPGALATLREAQIFLNEKRSERFDIIKNAGWL